MKSSGKRGWDKKKKWIVSAAAGIAAAAIGGGIWYYIGHNSTEPVYVYPFSYVGMTEYWGDSRESYGPVTTDKIQTVFLSDTQTVTGILVQDGDTVKKGDLLMTFDTTLSDLQLERKRLDVERLKLQLEDAQEELRRINSMKPMVTPVYEEEQEGTAPGEPASDTIYPAVGTIASRTYDGQKAESAIICWIRSDTKINDELFRNADARVAQILQQNTPEPTEPPETETTEPPETETTEPPETETTEPLETETTEPPETETTEPTTPEDMGGESAGGSMAEEVYLPVNSEFYVVIKVTGKVWQCLKVTKTDFGYAFQFADTVIADYSLEDDDTAVDTPQIDLGSGYTASQIAQLRSEQQKKIKDLQFQIKMAEAEYKIMQAEVDDGNVYAQMDGKVVSCLTEEEAKKTRQPVLKVSGGGGFYVEGFVSELEKDTMKTGQEVTINDWNTGMTYTGSIVSVGDFPTREGYFSGNGNPNASYYPFKVFVDESADLQAGSYVSVVYAAAEGENGIYLENPFLRKEQGRSYVLVLGADGKLEQRFVVTGKSLWGSYTEILSGLSAEDLVAFPYGKNVKPGIPAVEGDMRNLYG